MLTRYRVPVFVAAVGAVAFIAACGGGGEKPATPPAQPTPSATPGAPITPGAGGKVITVELNTDAAGLNRFTPSEIEAHQGDVLRFTLIQGVHNVHFLADSNPGFKGPTEPSPFLQLPGQTYDIAVDFPEGRYYFQCDPHALLGMTGHLKVEEREK